MPHTVLWAKYPALVQWHRQSGSYSYYIENLLAQAQAENAPVDAIYKQHGDDGKWVTLRDLKLDHPFRKAMQK